jgi:hypothetical protein
MFINPPTITPFSKALNASYIYPFQISKVVLSSQRLVVEEIFLAIRALESELLDESSDWCEIGKVRYVNRHHIPVQVQPDILPLVWTVVA